MRKSRKQKEADMPILPKLREHQHITRDLMLRLLEEAGAELLPEMRLLMRLPRYVVRGMNEELEFFDPLSIQPIPSRLEDVPAACIDLERPAPPWVTQRYLSITKAKKKTFITFIDAQRRVFLKGEISRQDELAQEIYKQMISVPDLKRP